MGVEGLSNLPQESGELPRPRLPSPVRGDGSPGSVEPTASERRVAPPTTEDGGRGRPNCWNLLPSSPSLSFQLCCCFFPAAMGCFLTCTRIVSARLGSRCHPLVIVVRTYNPLDVLIILSSNSQVSREGDSRWAINY